ncbi:ferritin-like domain-containing protein [Kitasatospora sp. LaBMicrA B282]|uniref:ferritin-like domain-containing protein n=1 Tax=Kitasatospora sp. LaBMicrA B282 TaxID=3420949 RepID=UPI003D13C17A
MLVTVAREPGPGVADQSLCLVRVTPDGARAVLLREKEVNVQTDQAALILEHPGGTASTAGGDSAHGEAALGEAAEEVTVTVRSLVRGRPAAVRGIRVRQYANPRAHPTAARPTRPIAVLRTTAAPDWAPAATLDTGPDGTAAFTLRGTRAGCARLLLAAPGEPAPAGYDDADELRHWSGAGQLALRVLPDDRRLDALPPERITFDLLYREVFAYYEFTSSFMAEEVFSLADPHRVATYARLCRQMSDPRNRGRTYYMPPTRDLSAARARLLLGYLRNTAAPAALPALVPATAPHPPGGVPATRAELVALLRDAVTVELATTLQYLYAVYSLPTHGTGLAYLRRGAWTERRLRLVSGWGGERPEDSIRSTLLRVAREEMIHFLVVNNLLMALGEPFHFPAVDFGTLNHRLPIPLDFALEGLGPASVHRFIALEQPDCLPAEPRYGTLCPGPPIRSPRGPAYHSISELYAAIRVALLRLPDLFADPPGGGEHHLFLRRSVNARHPDYQLQVTDLASALFAVDLVTEQGEGGVLNPDRPPGEESHHDSFRRIAALLGTLEAPGPGGAGRADGLGGVRGMRGMRGAVAAGGRVDEPLDGVPRLALPVLRNPTLRPGRPARQLIGEPLARQVAELADSAYELMALLMVQHFAERPAASLRRSTLMNASIDVMNGVLRPLAELLAALPAGVPGRTAGIPFELAGEPWPIPGRPADARRELGCRIRRLARAARACPVLPEQVPGVLDHLAGRVVEAAE